MIKYLVLLTVILLAGCTPSTGEIKESFVLPSELSHCKMYYMEARTSLNRVFVVHCPNSTTTTNTSGKFQQNITVVDQGETK